MGTEPVFSETAAPKGATLTSGHQIVWSSPSGIRLNWAGHIFMWSLATNVDGQDQGWPPISTVYSHQNRQEYA
jgi:hypothetical protein